MKSGQAKSRLSRPCIASVGYNDNAGTANRLLRIENHSTSTGSFRPIGVGSNVPNPNDQAYRRESCDEGDWRQAPWMNQAFRSRERAQFDEILLASNIVLFTIGVVPHERFSTLFVSFTTRKRHG
jgi:hypothetical protein